MEMTAQRLPLDALHESPWNPRRHFPAKPLEELAERIRTVGILSPLPVFARLIAESALAIRERR